MLRDCSLCRTKPRARILVIISVVKTTMKTISSSSYHTTAVTNHSNSKPVFLFSKKIIPHMKISLSKQGYFLVWTYYCETNREKALR
jgi:hypothetical protein